MDWTMNSPASTDARGFNGQCISATLKRAFFCWACLDLVGLHKWQFHRGGKGALIETPQQVDHHHSVIPTLYLMKIDEMHQNPVIPVASSITITVN